MSPANDRFSRKTNRAALALLAAALPPLAPPPAVKARLMRSLGLQGRFAEVSAVKGAYQLNGEEARGLRALADGDRVQAGPQGRLELRIPGQAVLLLMQGAQARLRKAATGYRLDLLQGAVLAHIKTGTRFLTAMPLGQIQVKGTYFYAEARGPGASYVCLCEGWVRLKAPGLSRELKTDHDQALELRLEKGRTQARASSAKHPHPRMSGF